MERRSKGCDDRLLICLSWQYFNVFRLLNTVTSRFLLQSEPRCRSAETSVSLDLFPRETKRDKRAMSETFEQRSKPVSNGRRRAILITGAMRAARVSPVLMTGSRRRVGNGPGDRPTVPLKGYIWIYHMTAD